MRHRSRTERVRLASADTVQTEELVESFRIIMGNPRRSAGYHKGTQLQYGKDSR